MTTTDELERSIRSRIDYAAENETQIFEWQQRIVDYRDVCEGIEERYILDGLQGSNETQRKAWLAGVLAEDEKFQLYREKERHATQSLAAQERQLRQTDRLRRMEMVLLQLHVDRRGEDHGTA